jgi:hypothetical protein
VPSETEFLGTVCIEREHERVRVAKCHMHTHVSIQKEWHALVPMNTVTRNSDAHTVGLGLIPLEYSPESLFILQDYFYVFVLDDESTRDEICYSPFCICFSLECVSTSLLSWCHLHTMRAIRAAGSKRTLSFKKY